MRRFLAGLACAAISLLVAGCGGGGGAGSSPGGGITTPAPPAPAAPVTTPPSPGPTGCIAATCLSTATTFNGPYYTVAHAAAAGGSVYSSTGDLSSAADGVTVQPAVGAAGPSYTLNRRYGSAPAIPLTNISATFNNLVDRNDGLGTVSSATTGDTTFSKFDVSSALSGSLDFVQLIGYSRAGSATSVDLGFQAYGRVTSTSFMPSTGSATFKGGARGVYYDGVNTFSTASDITMNVDFAAKTATGSTSNFRMVDAATGATAVGAPTLSFTFKGEVFRPLPLFSGDAVLSSSLPALNNWQGEVHGAFFGPAGSPPDEAGLVYTFNPLPWAPPIPLITGGAALGKVP